VQKYLDIDIDDSTSAMQMEKKQKQNQKQNSERDGNTGTERDSCRQAENQISAENNKKYRET